MRSLVAALVFAVTCVFAVGCGTDDETTSYTTETPPGLAQSGGGEPEPTAEPTAEPTEAPTEEPTAEPTAEPTSAPAAGGKGEEIEIVGTEFAFDPDEVSVDAGTVTLTLDNQGQAPHEIVVLDTDTPPDALPTGDDGLVPEDDAIGQVSEIPGGESASTTIDFEPGKYALVCNLPGHYASGMFGSLEVR